MLPTNRSFTKTYAEEFTITAADNVSRLSILPIGGTCTIVGTGTFQQQSSEPIVIPEGVPYSVPATAGCYLDGYTITPSSSVIVDIMI